VEAETVYTATVSTKQGKGSTINLDKSKIFFIFVINK